jgi:hypothetical protein
VKCASRKVRCLFTSVPVIKKKSAVMQIVYITET